MFLHYLKNLRFPKYHLNRLHLLCPMYPLNPKFLRYLTTLRFHLFLKNRLSLMLLTNLKNHLYP